MVGIAAFLLRTDTKIANALDPYAANLKFSDMKMSAAENFVGSPSPISTAPSPTPETKPSAMPWSNVTFKDSLGQVVQAEDVALRILQTSGPYPEAVDLSVAPVGPGPSKPFRLTFEHVTADWNHEYPELQVTEVAVK